MSWPSELKAFEKRINTFHFSSLEYFCVGHFVLSLDVKQVPKASHVERVQLLGVTTIHSSCFADV